MLEVPVMEAMKRILGAEHSCALISIGSLSSTHQNQGRWKEAQERGKGAWPKVFFCADQYGELAITWERKGRGSEAVELIEECVQQRTRVFCIDYADTITILIT